MMDQWIKNATFDPCVFDPRAASEGSARGIKNTPLYYVDKKLALILDPYPHVRCYRVISGRMSTGFVPHPDSHPGSPSQASTQGHRPPLIRDDSTKAENEKEGKTKMGFQNWATPPAFIAWCEKEVLPTYGYDRFSLNACAEPHNAKALRFLAPTEDVFTHGPGCIGVNGLNASWANYGAVWCNPGFSACAQWLDKAASEADKGTTSLVLTHACHGARWFGTRLAKANAVYLINPRINFLPPEGVEPSSNNRDSYLWVFSGRCRPTQKFVYPNPWRN